MGKKVKKKARSGQKDRRISSAASETAPKKSTASNTETTDNVTTVVKDKRVCPHVEKGVNLEILTSKFWSLESVKCEDCRDDVDSRRVGKGKGKQGKKKGGGDPKSGSKAIWVCLECGHFSCGGVGFAATPQTHAMRHAKKCGHPLAIQFENPQLRWCFHCNMLIPAEKSGDSVEQKYVLNEVVKMMKIRPAEGPSLDAEEIWFGSGSVTSSIISENCAGVGSSGRNSYEVRGLVNLGNTCFFNSVMQNLLGLDRLRDCFCKLDGSIGPLTAALKKLVAETNPESGLRNVINPRSFFGSVCAKASQFRGYQQQDSHELLRCLLDGLSTEELIARKQNKSFPENGYSEPTFVDAIFGGQLSSTVTCLECGHSSLVSEPFLDLSLPVPTKKPPSKKAQPNTRAKKPKPPPKRNARIHPKIGRDKNTVPCPSVSETCVGGKSSCQVQSSVHVPEQNAVPSGDSALFVSTDANVVAGSKSATTCSLSSAQHAESSHAIQNAAEKPTPSDDFTWLDFLEADSVSNNNTTATEMDDLSVNHDSADENAVDNHVTMSNSLEGTGENISMFTDAGDVPSQIDEKLVFQDSGVIDGVQSEVNLENGSGSCSLTCSKDLNLGVDSSGKFSEEETPLLIQDSEVLLLPYKEDTLTTSEMLKTEGQFLSALSYEQDSLEFEGFGDLFNEPEDATPSMNPSSINSTSEAKEGAQADFGGNSSESEPDEVDNTEAPASVESCLSYFTKPELLLKNEHAWQCENCSKILPEQRMRLRKKFHSPQPETVTNRGIHTSTSGLSRLNENQSLPSEVRHLCNGNLKNETIGISDDSFISHDGNSNVKQNCMLGNRELNLVVSRMEDIKCEVDLAPVCLPESSGGDTTCCKLDNNYQNFDGCHIDEPSFNVCTDTNVQKKELHTESARCESEGSADADKKPVVKVKRDATKRILINRAPPILTIHLKRFSQDARGRLSKLSGYVQFNHTIDLKPYMNPRCMEKDIYKYHLVGVVEHLGTMRGGHYVAYVRGGMKSTEKADKEDGDYVWYHASDAYVREASLEEVLRSEAYILFYERI
ncbi:hypothetical protein ACH5RR_031779 [Cinchona calisaya]|uniref:ubiquitinyl hydrolase 1 n=1 Tax=Cinchona calisaya TaxID=153742 RepID=A0ABD2YG87_9GENT